MSAPRPGKLHHITALFLPFVVLAGCETGPRYDVLITGGTIVDGSGEAAFVGDVAIRDDRIVAVGPNLESGPNTTVFDVTGRVVAPGFWDNHAHLVTLEEHPDAENFIRQGITTILAPLHSQDQPFPIDAYEARVRMAPNVGLFAGHTWIRKRVMGLENRAPSMDELEWMRALVDSAMVQGALGLSTGLEYVPAVFADTDEIVALAEVATPYGGIYVTHMRDEGVRVLESIRETLEVGRRAGIPVQVNHHKVTGSAHWGSTEQTLALLDSASAAGQEVAHDVYPYTAFSTYSDLLFPGWALADGAEAFAGRVADPSLRARMVREMNVIFLQQTGSGPESIRFRDVEAFPEWQGRTLREFLLDRGREPTVAEAVEALIELQLAGGFIGVFEGMSNEDVIRIMQHPTAMFETDGDLVEPGVGFPHPRSYGSFPRVLGQYVRDEGALSIEQAIHKMTALPAAWIGDNERGRIEPDAIADIVVFDPETIRDRAEYTDPHHYPEGVVHVLVAGIPVLQDGEMTSARPGRFLDRKRSGS